LGAGYALIFVAEIAAWAEIALEVADWATGWAESWLVVRELAVVARARLLLVNDVVSVMGPIL
jgi:hypothetical protein